jgi:pseudouridine-5'-monophosphatase
MRISHPVTHVIFDLDGVLLDTEPFYTQVTQAIVERYGKAFDWSIKGDMVGRPAIESARYLIRALDLPMTPEQFLRERELLLEQLVPNSRPMRGAQELTSVLAERKVPQSIATSSHRRLYELKTQHHLRNGKPAPDIFLLAAQDLGVDPSRCAVIEDSPAGIVAAHAAGMQTIAVPDPAMDRTRFAEANLILGSLTELSLDDLGLEG